MSGHARCAGISPSPVLTATTSVRISIRDLLPQLAGPRSSAGSARTILLLGGGLERDRRGPLRRRSRAFSNQKIRAPESPLFKRRLCRRNRIPGGGLGGGRRGPLPT